MFACIPGRWLAAGKVVVASEVFEVTALTGKPAAHTHAHAHTHI